VKFKLLNSLFLAALAPIVWAQGSAEPLTLQRVIDTYITKNLELQAAQYRLERTRADQIAAALRPNPGLTLSAQNLKINGPAPPANGLYEFEAAYSDTIEWVENEG
jgi:outer membrane protein TolC